ncbi:hypothetical protein ACJJTC_019285 [Scirpophaga incertulas]
MELGRMAGRTRIAYSVVDPSCRSFNALTPVPQFLLGLFLRFVDCIPSAMGLATLHPQVAAAAAEILPQQPSAVATRVTPALGPLTPRHPEATQRPPSGMTMLHYFTSQNGGLRVELCYISGHCENEYG